MIVYSRERVMRCLYFLEDYIMSAMQANPNEKLEIFLKLVTTYIESVFNWNIDIDQLRPLISKIQI